MSQSVPSVPMDGKNKKYYVVVEFIEEMQESGTIPMAVVSSTWLTFENDRTFCRWPSYLKTDRERIKAVTDHTKVDLQKCGSLSIVNIKYNTRNYQHAIMKLKSLEFLSSVSNSSSTSVDDEDTIIRKRQIKKKQFDDYYESYSSDEEIVPIAPRLFQDSNKEKPKGPANVQTSITASGTPEHKTFEKTVSTTSTKAVQCTSCSVTAELIRQLTIKVDGLVKDVSYLTRIVQDNNTGDVTLLANSEVDRLPVSTKEELDQLNTNLDDADVMTAMCSSLQIVGGKDTIDTTRRVLSKMLKNRLALTFNWSGRNDKNCFADYKNILKLIMVAVRKNSFSRSATQQEVESVIKVWLRNAHDRDGGRKARCQNSNK